MRSRMTPEQLAAAKRQSGRGNELSQLAGNKASDSDEPEVVIVINAPGVNICRGDQVNVQVFR